MLKHRIIPIVLIDGFSVLKTINFDTRRNLGSPITVLRTYETRNVDELIMLDINASFEDRYFDRWLVEELSAECFMPLTIGGGIKSCNEIEDLLSVGADKVSINTSALTDLKFVKEAVTEFGSQCIVASVDIFSNTKIYNKRGLMTPSLLDHIKFLDDCDVGEYLFCDVSREGTMSGPNVKLALKLSQETSKPIIYAGGVSQPSDCSDLIEFGKIEAVGCSSIFHFTNFTPEDCRADLRGRGLPARHDY
jgi:imidazole glycerol-phosphate synthase subunit HisF